LATQQHLVNTDDNSIQICIMGPSITDLTSSDQLQGVDRGPSLVPGTTIASWVDTQDGHRILAPKKDIITVKTDPSEEIRLNGVEETGQTLESASPSNESGYGSLPQQIEAEQENGNLTLGLAEPSKNDDDMDQEPDFSNPNGSDEHQSAIDLATQENTKLAEAAALQARAGDIGIHPCKECGTIFPRKSALS
jgi:hypothetical protein